MRTLKYLLLLPFLGCLGCVATKERFDPDRKYAPEQLRQDYLLFRNILEESHPSLYWYETKDSLDYFFDWGYRQLTDSMTEPAFKSVLSYVISKIDCGHTSVRYSKKYSRYLDTVRDVSFPFALKFWDDTMVVTANLNRGDSVLKRGTIIKSIDGWTQPQLRDSLFNFIVTDGYSRVGKYQSLSTGFTFANLYKTNYGLPLHSAIRYIDSLGQEQELRVPMHNFKADTAKLKGKRPGHSTLEMILFSPKSLQIDTTGKTGFMTLNTFDQGHHLKKFFARSFRALQENQIQDLVIDVRSNGGGNAANSTLLTRYLINKKFKLADSLYAVTRTSQYHAYIEKSFIYHMMMLVVTSKRADGKYHFGYFERHYYKPKKDYHFDGHVYILIGGNSFSATTLFAGALKGQPNVTLVGEETGGGYYGNTAWIIPDVTLPNTEIRFRLPKFRLIVDRNRPKTGHGVMPDVAAMPSTESIREGIDFKVAKTRELILDSRSGQSK
jgi:Peptidase family S41